VLVGERGTFFVRYDIDTTGAVCGCGKLLFRTYRRHNTLRLRNLPSLCRSPFDLRGEEGSNYEERNAASRRLSYLGTAC